ncbi:MAG: tetratricopeptide repeat protein [Pirellulales bacterium]|nr:tetratricopeptide repeat protein [Pirellulales bacterium]
MFQILFFQPGNAARIRKPYFDASYALLVLLCLVITSGCNWVAQNNNLNGVASYRRGDLQAADQAFRQALQNDPNNAEAYYNLGSLYHHIAKTSQRPVDWQQAESFYQQALAKNPQLSDAYNGLSTLLTEERRGPEAVALLENWARQNPQSAEPLVALSQLSAKLEDPARAQQYLYDAIRLEPTNAQALAALGKMREDAGQIEQALANYQRALQQDFNQPAVQERLAALQRQYLPPPATSPTPQPMGTGQAVPPTGTLPYNPASQPNPATVPNLGPNSGRLATQPSYPSPGAFGIQ